MGRARSTWLTPLLVACAVIALVVGMRVIFELTRERVGTGPDPDETPGLQFPTGEPTGRPLAPSEAQLMGYRVRGNWLFVSYRARSGGCVRLFVEPRLEETDSVVAVTLVRGATGESRLRGCPTDYLPGEAVLHLQRPLGKRSVIDGMTGRVLSPLTRG